MDWPITTAHIKRSCFMLLKANDWAMSGQGGIHQLPSRTFTRRNEGGYFLGEELRSK